MTVLALHYRRVSMARSHSLLPSSSPLEQFNRQIFFPVGYSAKKNENEIDFANDFEGGLEPPGSGSRELLAMLCRL